MNSVVEWNITPAAFLGTLGWKFKERKTWISVELCPFCEGGDHRDKYTLIVHVTDGNYSCRRSKCGMRGSFWKLIESQGHNPRDFKGDRQFQPKPKKKRYINGQWQTKG